MTNIFKQSSVITFYLMLIPSILLIPTFVDGFLEGLFYYLSNLSRVFLTPLIFIFFIKNSRNFFLLLLIYILITIPSYYVVAFLSSITSNEELFGKQAMQIAFLFYSVISIFIATICSISFKKLDALKTKMT